MALDLVPLESTVWIARTVLGLSFLVYGLAKLLDLPSFVEGAVSWDVLGPAIVRPLARLLPFAEVFVGALLLLGFTVQLAATGAVLILGTFARVLQSGGIILGFMLATILTYLVGDVLRRLGSEEGALIPQEGLALRSVAPDIEMTNLRSGETFRTSELGGKRLMIAFLSGSYRPCQTLVPHLNELAAKSEDTRFIVVVDEGAGERHLADFGPQVAVVEDGAEWPVGSAFEVRMSPLVYVIDGDGLVSIRAVPNTRVQLEDALDGSGHLQRAAWTPAVEAS